MLKRGTIFIYRQNVKFGYQQISALALLLLGTALCCSGALQPISMPIDKARAPAAPQAPSATNPAAGRTETPQNVNFPYYSLRDDCQSVLVLNYNGRVNTSKDVTVTFYDLGGASFQLPPVTIPTGDPVRIDAGQALQGLQSDFSQGSVNVSYTGTAMEITGQITITSTYRRYSIQSRMAVPGDYKSNVLASILWIPKSSMKASLVLSNVGTNPMNASLSVVGGMHGRRDVRLQSRETRVVDVSEVVHDNEPHVLTIQHDSSAADLIGTGFVIDSDTGYSSDFNLIDSSAQISNTLVGVHFLWGQPAPAGGYPAGTLFKAPLILANVAADASQVKVAVDYTKGQETNRASLEPVVVASGEVRTLWLERELANAGVSDGVDDASVEIDYCGCPRNRSVEAGEHRWNR